MNQTAHAQQGPSPVAVATTQPTRNAAAGGEARSYLLRRLATVREMLSTIESVTLAGQRYAMTKIVACLEEQVASRCTDASGRARLLLVNGVQQLDCESRRAFPDPPVFTEHAHRVLTLLTEVACC